MPAVLLPFQLNVETQHSQHTQHTPVFIHPLTLLFLIHTTQSRCHHQGYPHDMPCWVGRIHVKNRIFMVKGTD